MWLFFYAMFDQNNISTSEFESQWRKKDERFFCLCQWPKPHSCTLSRLRNYRNTIKVIPFSPISFEAFGIERKKEISFRSDSLSQASACRITARLKWTDGGLACCTEKKKERYETAGITQHSFQNISVSIMAQSLKIMASSYI